MRLSLAVQLRYVHPLPPTDHVSTQTFQNFLLGYTNSLANASSKWTLQQEVFFLCTGISAFLDGFITTYAETVKLSTDVLPLLYLGSCNIASIQRTALCDTESGAEALTSKFRSAIKTFTMKHLSREFTISSNKPIREECNTIVREHVYYLFSVLGRKFPVLPQPTPSNPTKTKEPPGLPSEAPEPAAKVQKRVRISPQEEYDAFRCRASAFWDQLCDMVGITSTMCEMGRLSDRQFKVEGVHIQMFSKDLAEFCCLHRLLGYVNNDITKGAYRQIGGVNPSDSRSNIVLSPLPTPQPASALHWLRDILDGIGVSVDLSEIAIRIPRRQETVPNYRDSFNAISQYFMGGVSGVGPKLYAVLLFPAELLPGPTHSESSKMATIFIVQRMNGMALFNVPSTNWEVRRDKLIDLFERMSKVNAYLLDSKELNIMMHSDERGERLYVVDWDPSWSGFVWNRPTRINTFALNVLIYGLNVISGVYWMSDRVVPNGNFSRSRRDAFHQLWLRSSAAVSRAVMKEGSKCEILATTWRGQGVRVHYFTGLPSRAAKEPSGMTDAELFTQEMVFDRAVRSQIRNFTDLYIGGVLINDQISHYAETNGRIVRFFTRKMPQKTTVGEMLLELCSSHFGSDWDTLASWNAAHAPTCSYSELRSVTETPVSASNIKAVKNVLGYLDRESWRNRAWQW